MKKNTDREVSPRKDITMMFQQTSHNFIGFVASYCLLLFAIFPTTNAQSHNGAINASTPPHNLLDFEHSSEELFDPSQQPAQSELLNGFLMPQLDENDEPVTELVSSHSDNEDRATSANGTFSHNASKPAEPAEQYDAIATTLNVDDDHENEPFAQPHRQNQEDSLHLSSATTDFDDDDDDSVRMSSQINTTIADKIIHDADDVADAMHEMHSKPADGSQREAKTIVEPNIPKLDASSADSPALLPIPYELTLNKQLKSFEAEYDEPSTSIHNGLDYSSSSTRSLATDGTPQMRTIDTNNGQSETIEQAAPTFALDATSPLTPATAQTSTHYVTPASSPSTVPATTTVTTTTALITTSTTATNAPLHRLLPKVETTVGIDEILRRHVYESHVRSPLAVLVDATSNVLRKTRTLLGASLKPQPNLDVILMTFNMSGEL